MPSKRFTRDLNCGRSIDSPMDIGPALTFVPHLYLCLRRTVHQVHYIFLFYPP